LNSPIGFKKNFFKAGTGRENPWRKFTQIYNRQNGKVKSTLTYLVGFDQREYITAAYVNSVKNIFYNGTNGQVKGVTIQPGKLALQFTPTQIPGTKGFCRLNIVPVSISARSSDYLPDELKNNEKIIFNSAGFNIEISEGDFILIGPEKFIDHQHTLPGLLFCRQSPEPKFRMFLILCKEIKI
jgi:hypothetical protein